MHGSPELEQLPRNSQRCVVGSQPPVQHCEPEVQISPSARQVSCVEQRLTPVVVVGTHQPLQQLPALEQISPSTSQPEPAVRHTPPVHTFEQHWALPVQALPCTRHVVVSLHTPPTQPVEQQSAAVVHASPAM